MKQIYCTTRSSFFTGASEKESFVVQYVRLLILLFVLVPGTSTAFESAIQYFEYFIEFCNIVIQVLVLYCTVLVEVLLLILPVKVVLYKAKAS